MKRAKQTDVGCLNCRTVRYPIYARGYCNRCYRLVRKLEIIEQWDLRVPQTLRGYPQLRSFRREEILRALRHEFTHQIRRRLEFLRHREEQRESGVDGYTIELLLRQLAKAAGARGEVHYGVASWIDHTFPPAQHNALFRLLQDIEDKIPWRGLNMVEALGGIFLP